MGQTVTIGYGKAVLSNTTATFSSMKVKHPFQRVSAVTSGVARGQRQATMVGQHEHTGVLISAPVDHEQGTVIVLQSSWKRTGSPIRDGALFLRLRLGAPLYNVVAFVPTGHEVLCGDSFLMFSGYADILNADELEQLGIEVNNSYMRKFMEDEEIEECFSITRVTSETQPRPSLVEIETPTGAAMKEVAAMPSRRIILRRRA